MKLLVIIMISAFILSIISGISFYYKHTKPAQEAIKRSQLDRQSSFFECINELVEDKTMSRAERISNVQQIATDSAAVLTKREADERIDMIWKLYHNNVFKEQLAKTFFAVPHLFRIQSARIFMDELAELNEDIQAGEVADVLADFEAITILIYEGTHSWDSSRVQAHLQSIEELWALKR